MREIERAREIERKARIMNSVCVCVLIEQGLAFVKITRWRDCNVPDYAHAAIWTALWTGSQADRQLSLDRRLDGLFSLLAFG